MPPTLKFISKMVFVSLSLGALVFVALPSRDEAPAARGERETTLASLSKPGAPIVVSASPTVVLTSAEPVTLSVTIEAGVAASHVNVSWALPTGVTLVSGSLLQVISHLDAGQPATFTITVTVDESAHQPILVNALFAHGAITVGNGTSISVNPSAPATPTIKRTRLNYDSTGDQRIFE